MKQVLQHLRDGRIELADVPCPIVRPGHLLIQTTASLISAGTERMLVEFGQAGWIAKARSQPDKVKQVLQKIKTDGLFPTLEAVFSRLDEPLPLGYCNVGRVVEVGRGADAFGFSVGDRVASNGPHAEMVCVPATMAAKAPDNVDDASASFTVLGSIALHGMRLLEPTLGERFVVVGLGLLGQVAVQLLRANGCNVLGIDVNPQRCDLAKQFGAETACVGQGADPVQAALAFSRGAGVDGVLITASAKTDEIMHQAAQSCRKRGRIVLVGVVGLDLMRSDFYEKELTFQVSCAYGPGRYDPVYEGQARDYPRPYVRWTVARNFEAMLDSMAQGRLIVAPMVTKTMPQAEAAGAYDAIVNDASVLGLVMTYPAGEAPLERRKRLTDQSRDREGAGSSARHEEKNPLPHGRGSAGSAMPLVGVIGAGNFTKLILLPAIKAAGSPIQAVASAGGVTGFHAARKFEAEEASTDHRALLADARVAAVFITTRHSAHAGMVCEALEAGKHVFVEKPLAIDEEGLQRVREAYDRRPELQLMVGFNRRFAPHAVKARELLQGRSQPVAVGILVNAGFIPADNWNHDPESGGGRIIGEGCHFVDLARFLVGSPIATVQAVMVGEKAGVREDKMTISLTHADGSISTVQYWANGPKSFPKERVEVFSEGRVLQIDNWRRLNAWEWRGAPSMRMSQDKGHKAEVAAFLNSVRATASEQRPQGATALEQWSSEREEKALLKSSGTPHAKAGSLIPFDELDEVTRATFAAMKSAREGVVVGL